VANTYRVSVGDGQLNLRLDDLGGTNGWVMINAMDIVYVGPDLTGPRVVSADQVGTVTGPVDRVRLSFSETIDPASFTTADVAVLEGPAGAITPTAVNWLGGGDFEVVFEPQNAPGNYRLVVGPDISDAGGNVMDQDQDGTGGESGDDQFETTFLLEAGPEYVARIDFGTAVSPVADDYIGQAANGAYDAALGYGWQTGPVYAVSRGSGGDLLRDFNYTQDATYAFDLANGEYDVIVTLGDTALAHDQMGVFLEGAQVDSVTTAVGETVANTYRVSVGDGQLNLRLDDLGGTNGWVMINAMDIVYVDSNIQSAALPIEFAVDPTLQFNDQYLYNFAPVTSPSAFTDRRFAKEKALNLFVSGLSVTPVTLVESADLETRERAIELLFGSPLERDYEGASFIRNLQAWDEWFNDNALTTLFDDLHERKFKL
jgi:hypothetical protein